MARSLRVHAPGVAVHVMSRGNNKGVIFTDSIDYQQYLIRLACALHRFNVICHVFCLLWNHLHLLLTANELPISRMMQQVNSSYCRWFNKRHGRIGHVIHHRFKDKLIDDAAYFLNAVRYIVLNPVAAGQVSRPEDWLWSSYRAMIGLAEPPDFLNLGEVWRALDVTDDSSARQRLITFVNEGADAGDGWRTLIEGSRDLVCQIDPLLEPHKTNPEFVYAHRFATRPPLCDVLGDASPGPSLDLAVSEAYSRHGYTLKEIAERVGKHPGTIWIWARRARRSTI